MKMSLRNGLLLLFLGISATVLCYGQLESGQLTGTITDPSGAVVSGAKITLTNSGTGQTRAVTSGANGTYFVTSLTPAVYELTIEAAGFQPYKQKVQISVGGRATADASLSLSTTGTTVEVIAEGGAEVNTQNQEISQVVNQRQISELPTITRNPYDLVATSGNISNDLTPSASGMANVNRGAGFNINGQRSASTDILLDGAENTDLFGVQVGQTVPLDSTQEFRVITSNFGAEYGRASGGVVNVATKSGTNDLHGTAYEFNRLSKYASNDYDSNARGLPKAVFTRNQFGFSVGGPIVKNKLFFFNNSEWIRVRSQRNVTALVPTTQFIGLSAGPTQQFFQALGKLATPINGPVLTQAQVLASSSKVGTGNPLFKALPANTPIFGTVNYKAPDDSGGGAPQNTYNIITRVDFSLSDKTTIFGRYTVLRQEDFAGFVNNSPYVGYNTGQTNFDNNALASVTHIFGPSLVSNTKFLFTRFNNLQPLGDKPVGPTLYFRADTSYNINGINVYGPGYSPTSPGNAIPFGGPQNFGEIAEDLSWTKGSHQFKFGGQYLYVKDNRTFGAYEEAVEALSASGIGSSYDNFLTGQLGLFQVAINPQGKLPCSRQPNASPSIVTPGCTINLPVSGPSFSRSNRFHDSALYITDTWKTAPRLSLNLGLRWEYYGVQHNNNQNLDSNFYFGSGATFFDQIRNGQVLTTPNSPDGSLWKPHYNNFAPRVGFAYDVFGDGKTSVRGGFGVGYERNFNNVTFNVIQNPPNYAVVSFQPPADAPTVAISPNNFGQFGSGTGTKALPPVTLRAVNPHIKTAYSEFYDLAIEREVIRNTTASIAYSGSRGVHLYSIANINRGASGNVYFGDTRSGSRINQQYSNINFRGSNGDSYYNAVNVGLRANNLSNLGLTMTANYTFAHSIDNTSSTFTDAASNNQNLGFLDPFNPALDRGNSDYDIRHRMTLSAVWDLPFYKQGSNAVARQVLGGWTLAPIYTARTGNPFSVFDCTNTAIAVCPRAIFDKTPKLKGSSDLGSPVDVNTFNYLTLPTVSFNYADPITGTGEYPTCAGLRGVGCAFPSNMSGRNAFRGPGYWNLDLGVYKNVKVKERYNLQFRSEFFNIANHANSYLILNGANDISSTVLPTTNLAGQKIANAGNPYIQTQRLGRRQIQFALKFIF